MDRSWYIAKYAGIPIKVHWTFGFVIIFIAFVGIKEQFSIQDSLWFTGYIFTLFFCVVLHEYGHALVARKYGVNTRDIIISPIGGIARLESIPTIAIQEFFIAIAGPLVNVVIAIFLFIAFSLFFNDSIIPSIEQDDYFTNIKGFIKAIFIMNVALFLFNLIPAFPMDGGRILRSLISLKLGIVKATYIATIIARIISLGFIGFGVMIMHPSLIFIGIFIFYMSGVENKQTKRQNIILDLRIGEITNSKFVVMQAEEKMELVFDLYERNEIKNALVKDRNGEIIGSIPEIFIEKYIESKEEYKEEHVYRCMSQSYFTVEDDSLLSDVISKMNKLGVALVGVEQQHVLVSVVGRRDIEKFIAQK